METAALRRAVRWIDGWLTSAGRRSCTGRSQQALRDALQSTTPSARPAADAGSREDAHGGDRTAIQR